MRGGEEQQQALERADEAYARGDIDACVAHLSTAIRGFTAADDRRRAAITCARLGEVFANAMGNQTASRAWFTRARRLVEDLPPCIEQGWVAVAAMGCDVDDPADLLAAAQLALDRARQFGDVNLETKALADAGLAYVNVGKLTEGMALLDEAMALACGPADDTETAAKSACSFFTACYLAADFERVGSWADLLRQHGLISLQPGGPIFLSSHCASVQATLLVELGRWTEAEAVLDRAPTSQPSCRHRAGTPTSPSPTSASDRAGSPTPRRSCSARIRPHTGCFRLPVCISPAATMIWLGPSPAGASGSSVTTACAPPSC
jgi:tetratricopeptide (TPR) repeat protein